MYRQCVEGVSYLLLGLTCGPSKDCRTSNRQDKRSSGTLSHHSASIKDLSLLRFDPMESSWRTSSGPLCWAGRQCTTRQVSFTSTGYIGDYSFPSLHYYCTSSRFICGLAESTEASFGPLAGCVGLQSRECLKVETYVIMHCKAAEDRVIMASLRSKELLKSTYSKCQVLSLVKLNSN